MNEDLLIERLIRRQEIANEKILREIGKVLGEIGELTPSDAYTISQQLKYGESLDKIIRILSETSKINQKEIYEMLENDAIVNLNKTKKYFKARGLDFIPYEKNIPLKQKVMEVASATLKEYSNISRTAGLKFLNSKGKVVSKGIKEAYSELIDDAVLNVSTGKENFYEALKDQLETIGEYGVRSIEYEGGYSRRIDSAMRMNIQDGLNRLSIAQQEIVGEQFGANMVEVTHHANPAPDHINTVDGKQFALIDKIREQIEKGQEKEIKLSDIDGNRVKVKGKWYEDFNYVNNNLVRQVGTLNCYHRTFRGILGIDKPLYTEKELQKDKEANEKGFDYEGKHYTMYEGEQLMRKIETELRKTRETKIIAKSGKEKDLLDKMKARESKLISKYHEITKISGLQPKLERTRVLTIK